MSLVPVAMSHDLLEVSQQPVFIQQLFPLGLVDLQEDVQQILTTIFQLN